MNLSKSIVSLFRLTRKGALTAIAFSMVFSCLFTAYAYHKLGAGRAEEDLIYIVKNNSFPKDVIEVVSMKNQPLSTFTQDFEMNIKNIGKRNIYGVTISLRFPNARVNGSKIGARLFYGNPSLINGRVKAGSTDTPLEPGKTASLRFTPIGAKTLEKIISSGYAPMSAYDQVEFVCQSINFGDGTGYMGNISTDYNKLSKSSFNANQSMKNSLLANKFTPDGTSSPKNKKSFFWPYILWLLG